MTNEKPKRGGPGRGQGRKYLVDGVYASYIQITMTEDMKIFVKSQRGGASAYIRSLIEADIKKNSNK